MKIVPEEFGKLVFNENAMKKALSTEVFDKLEQTIKNGAVEKLPTKQMRQDYDKLALLFCLGG